MCSLLLLSRVSINYFVLGVVKLGKREELASEFESIAEELEKAAAHCRITGKRFSAHDVPSACAHIFASLGHISKAQKSIAECAEIHSNFAQLHGDE